METIDQNIAYASLERNLLPGRSLIDDRSERDRLHFLSQFASLINFYDENNNYRGNWTPFLLKDPVFLLATISQTRFEKWNLRYVQACVKIEENEPLTMTSTDLGQSFNQLFDLFTEVFVCIENWTTYMQKSGEQYDLRKYVLTKVENSFSSLFWALRTFKESLFKSDLVAGIMPVEQFYFTTAFRDKLWTENKDKVPYWELLELKQPLAANTAGDFFKTLKKNGDELLAFFNTIIQHAAPEYEKLKVQQSNYPDTTLLRTFVSLLKIQQDQQNGISEKYLQFYYHDILKQHKELAVPDEVMLCAETAKKDAAFHLPAATEFDAGMDADKNPVVYASKEEVTLNPAAITAAYTLSCLPEKEHSRSFENSALSTLSTFSTLSALYFQTIAEPGEVKREENGTIKQWQTFGGASPPPDTRIALGISFASPMLLLREGHRHIRFTLTFEKEIDRALFRSAAYYFSTATAWLPATRVPDVSEVVGGNGVTIEFKLAETEPAIEKFLEDPNGLNSAWPMFKIEFASFTDMAEPPVLTDLVIDVNVTGLKNMQLYSDDGLLTTKTPFQLFGPIPLLNSSFIIGSNEIFSKPFNDLTIELDWDTLPADFAVYYKQYNQYITELNTPKGQQEKEPPPPPSRFKRFLTIISKIFLVYWIAKLFKKKKKEEEPAKVVTEDYCEPFNNSAFRVDFKLLRNQDWKTFDMLKKSKVPGSKDHFVPYKSNTGCGGDERTEYNLLFSMDGRDCKTKDKGDCNLTNRSYFGYKSRSGEKADPYIQDTPLEFTDASTSGFMRMTLDQPVYGFGAEVYPNVVSEIALQNAVILMSIDKDDTKDGDAKKEKKTGRRRKAKQDNIIVLPVFKAQAVLPFVPKLTGFTANYSATQAYDLSLEKEDYPLQCFFYSPFESYPVYDNSPGAVLPETSAGFTFTGVVWARSGLPLFPQMGYKGVLFLQIEDLAPADSLNIFFKLSRKYANSPRSRTVHYNYLATTGWKSLEVLSDYTNNFTCSGVIKVNVPQDMATDSLVLPEKKYWIAIGVKEDPGSFAETVYLKTNGFAVQRSGIAFRAVTEKPWIPANVITKTKTAVPEISTIVQPFPSQGGRAAETDITMNRRVSNRMKTKDRAVINEDYFRLIRQGFDDIYYSKVIYNREKKTTEIYVVKAYDRATDPSAFVPLVSECMEENIESFLKERASFFARIRVSNFKIEYVKVVAIVRMQNGYEEEGVRKDIINGINVFLSPWIASTQPQIAIDQGISDSELAKFIGTIAGVASVESVSLMTSPVDTKHDNAFSIPPDQQGRVIKPVLPSALFVPYLTHDISIL